MNQKTLNVIYGVVIVLLITVVAYFAIGRDSEQLINLQTNNSEIPSPTPTSIPSPTPTSIPSPTPTSIPSPTANWIVYSNAQYGFELKLPPYWKGYKTKVSSVSDERVSVGFDFPYTFNGAKTFYEDAFLIIRYTHAEWSSLPDFEGSRVIKIGENQNYVYAYAIGTDLGGDSELEMAGNDMSKVIATIKLK